MQQIERYGVMVLLLMLVTILVVSLWDGEAEAADRSKAGRPAAVAAATPARSNPATQSSRPRQAATRPRETRSVPLGATASRTPTAAPRGPRASNRRSSQRQSAPVQSEIRTVGTQQPSARGTLPLPSTSTEPATPRMAGATNPASTNGSERPRRARFASGVDPEAAERVATDTGRRAAPVTTRSEPAANRARAETQAWTYEIKSGDTLGGIASRVLGDENRWREIQNANAGLDPRRLMVGAKINLPGRARTGAVVSTVTPRAERTRPARDESAPRATDSSTSGRYVVKSGDVLSQVAQDQLGSASRWREIAALNPGLDPNRMHVGAKLVMPGHSGASTPRSTSRTTPRVAVADATPSRSADERFRVR